MTLAALDATLRLYLNEEQALREVPVLRLLGTPSEELEQRARALASRLEGVPGLTLRVRPDTAYVGGGSLPDQAMKTWVVEVQPAGLSDEQLAYRLRTGTPAVVGRLSEGKLLLDVRTIFPEQEGLLAEAIQKAMHSSATP
jgi:L-seryl-tRNA(Ser) seleniumtransferase